MVTTQIGGPSNNGGIVGSDANHAIVRTNSNDPTGDALARYSALFPPPAPPVNPVARVNEPAADFISATIGPELDFPAGTTVSNGGFTVTLKVADLSTTALVQALADTGSQSLLWVWRFTNGHQDAALSARWNPSGFTYGFNDFTTGAVPCLGGPVPGPAPQEKCIASRPRRRGAAIRQPARQDRCREAAQA